MIQTVPAVTHVQGTCDLSLEVLGGMCLPYLCKVWSDEVYAVNVYVDDSVTHKSTKKALKKWFVNENERIDH